MTSDSALIRGAITPSWNIEKEILSLHSTVKNVSRSFVSFIVSSDQITIVVDV
jgi:hypothetical protein